MTFASRDDYSFPQSIRRNCPQAIFSAVFENECNGLCEVSARLLLGSPLAIGPGHFRTVGNVPPFVSFDHGSEFVTHLELLHWGRPYPTRTSLTLATASPRGTMRASPPDLGLTSTSPFFRLRGLTTMRTGRPSRSASLNFTPADSSRSS